MEAFDVYDFNGHCIDPVDLDVAMSAFDCYPKEEIQKTFDLEDELPSKPVKPWGDKLGKASQIIASSWLVCAGVLKFLQGLEHPKDESSCGIHGFPWLYVS